MNIEEYLNKSSSAYHAVKCSEEVLLNAGFTELKISERFKINESGKYYIKPFPTALFAFIMPKKINRITIAMAHTDFPCFKLKPVPDLNSKSNCNLINVEPYGGSLKKTWFDRPLGIAGVIIVKTDNILEPREILFDSNEAWCLIPSLAPHMDREIEKKDIDPSKEMNPIITLSNLNSCDYFNSILDMIADRLNINSTDILSFDLNLYDTSKAENIGFEKEFIHSGKIDNIVSCGAITEAITNLNNGIISFNGTMPLIALFDNEEIGSRTKQGADSNILSWIIKKILIDSEACSNDSEMIEILSKSMMISCDGAHAVHPNYPEKADTSTRAELGKGFVIKTSASQRYVSDPKMLAIIRGLCEKENIAYQLQANKSGTPGGQTLGPIASSYLPVMAADVGIPMLGMHSIRELASVYDYNQFENFIIKILSM